MRILVDTTVWSLALRRRATSPTEAALVDELRDLIRDGRAAIIGPIRQEILSGIAEPGAFRRIRGQLASFPDLPLSTADYESAAAMYNACRRRGVAAWQVDLLICAAASRHTAPIFTTDRDFERYAEVLGGMGVALHRSRGTRDRTATE